VVCAIRGVIARRKGPSCVKVSPSPRPRTRLSGPPYESRFDCFSPWDGRHRQAAKFCPSEALRPRRPQSHVASIARIPRPRMLASVMAGPSNGRGIDGRTERVGAQNQKAGAMRLPLGWTMRRSGVRWDRVPCLLTRPNPYAASRGRSKRFPTGLSEAGVSLFFKDQGRDASLSGGSKPPASGGKTPNDWRVRWLSESSLIG